MSNFLQDKEFYRFAIARYGSEEAEEIVRIIEAALIVYEIITATGQAYDMRYALGIERLRNLPNRDILKHVA